MPRGCRGLWKALVPANALQGMAEGTSGKTCVRKGKKMAKKPKMNKKSVRNSLLRTKVREVEEE